ncbi:MAG: LemA family protein [Spirochaetia bacterium]|nr:LemA family protein [Spirochaetia bacterium]
MNQNFKIKKNISFSAFLLLITLIFSAQSCGINNIPTYDEAVKASWSQVLNQYKRRADLVPMLVNTVKGYAAHEKSVLVGVTEARAKVTQTNIPADILTNKAAFAQFQQNQANLSGALSRLMVVMEKYPDLKANQNFIELQSQLEGTENRISVARRDYISAVQKYNTEIRTVPGSWWRALMYKDAVVKENFTVEDAVQTAPEVKF